MRSAVAVCAAVAFVVACSKGGSNADSAGGALGASTTPAAAPPPAPPPTVMTDQNVVAKLGGGDSAEVALGKLVASKATNAGVKSYAQMLVTDHSANAKQLAALVKKDSLTPQPPPGDNSATENQQKLDKFQAMAKGMDFDTAFVNDAIADHQKEIDALTSAQASLTNADLKALIGKTIPVMQKHLDKAKELQGKLTSTKTQ